MAELREVVWCEPGQKLLGYLTVLPSICQVLRLGSEELFLVRGRLAEAPDGSGEQVLEITEVRLYRSRDR